MPLFAGLRYVNNMRAAKVARERGVHDLQVVRDNVALEVMKAYINVIYYKLSTYIITIQSGIRFVS